MMVFTRMTGATVMLLMLHFLMRSRFSPGKMETWKQWLRYFLCWVVLCPAFPWWVQLLLTLCAAGFLGWYVGNARIAQAALFGLLFGALRAAAMGMGVLFQHPLAEWTGLYALTVCAAFLGQQWRMVPLPFLQLVPVWLVLLLLCEEVIRGQDRDGIAVLELFSNLWLVYAGVSMTQVCKKMDAELQVILNRQQLARQYALQEEYYQQLRSKQSETRALWHDLNKYLRAAQAEASSAQALHQLEAMLDSAMEIVDVGNPILNVILNEYAHAAKAAGISLRLKVQAVEELWVSSADLYILIGNTMDNAMEACKALPPNQRFIDLTLRTHHDVLYYKLTNPCACVTEKRQHDPMRGYGLQNVRRCVEHYDGTMDAFHENSFFVVTAHLNRIE